MNWSDTYLLNEKTIDSHHIKLIDVMSSLENKQSLDKKEFFKTLDFLVDYAGYHFEYEENLMKEKNYPQREVHIRLHKSFMDKLQIWIEGFKDLPDEITYKEIRGVFQFGIAWLNRHILTVDRKFVDFLEQSDTKK